MKTTIKATRFVASEAIQFNYNILIENGTISEIIPVDSAAPPQTEIDTTEYLVAPGYIDLHTHGAVGYNFISASHEQLDKIGTYFASHGVTRYLATLMETKQHTIGNALENFHTYKPAASAAIPIGIHLEGPYLSPQYPGDMGSENVRHPDPAEYIPWLDSGLVKMITLAPELPGSLELIQAAKARNIIVSIGHGAPNEMQVQAAFEAGATQISHMFNQMLGLNHHQSGLVDAALLNENIALQIIADEDHLHPVTLQVITKLKQPQKIMLITDSTEENGAAASPHPVDKAMPGTLTMDQAVRNILQFTSLSPWHALQMASNSAAASLNLENQFGKIAPGAAADFVILDESFRVQKTIINGQVAFDAKNKIA
jgi:N-acetylglucosamine-6-phosphate deacetylase